MIYSEEETMAAHAVFLDKDGTLIEDIPYNVDPERIKFMPGALSGLERLQTYGFRLVVVSNQAGVARGKFREADVDAVAQRLRDLASAAGIHLSGFYFCPHDQRGVVSPYARECNCRKPAPGLVLRAATELDLDTKRSWLVGDILDDVEAGRRAGCRTILIDNGHETEWLSGPSRSPDYYARDLLQAADLIITSTASGFTNRKRVCVPSMARGGKQP